MNPIISINDARLLGIPEACKVAFPSLAAVPGADEVNALLAERNNCEDDEVDGVDKKIIEICLSITLPSASEWKKMKRHDYSGKAIQDSIRGILHFSGLTGGGAAELIGIDARTFRRYIQTDGQTGFKPMPYTAWFTLLTKTRHDAVGSVA